ncbi:MAG: hypothetical protein WCE64_07890 [Bacteroidales bacterium]
MLKLILSFSLLLFSFSVFGINAVTFNLVIPCKPGIKDSLDYQILYNGRFWENQIYNTDGHQFFLSSDFASGSVIVDGYKYDSIKIKYDIFNDELLIRRKDGVIVQLNKELIDSFCLNFNNETLSFKNIEDQGRNLTGYYNVLYDSGIRIYVKYRKEILPTTFTNGPPRFNQVNKIYIIKEGQIHRTDTRKDLLILFMTREEKQMIKEYIRNNHFRISRDDPGIFRRVIEYYETIKK